MIKAQKSEVVLAGPNGEPLVQKTPGVCGGSARVGNTRIAVWLLVEERQLGISDVQLLTRHVVPLTQAHLDAAWSYYGSHREEIDLEISRNRECMEDS